MKISGYLQCKTFLNVGTSQETRTSIKGTPMLRIAYDAIKRAAIKYQWLVPLGSLNDLVAENQVFDSPYNNTYTPIKKNLIKKVYSSLINIGLEENDIHESFYDPEQLSSFKGEKILPVDKGINKDLITLKSELDSNGEGIARSQTLELGPVQRILISYSGGFQDQRHLRLLLNNPKKTGWIGCSIANELLLNKSTTSKNIAEKINIPVNTVERVRKRLKI